VTLRLSTRTLALIVGLALFMQSLDATILVTAFPAMAQSFHTPVLTLHIAITSYLVGAAMCIPISGWLADRFGARTIFCSAIAGFVATSALCGFSRTVNELVAARALQGAAGALLLPIGRLILLNGVPKAQLFEAMTYFAFPPLIGPLLGPPLGAAFATYASWRWVFYVNLPIGLVGLVLAAVAIPPGPGLEPRRLDVPGLALSALSLVGLSMGFEHLASPIMSDGIALLVVLAGGLSALAYVLHARRTPEPIIDLSLMRIPTFAACTIASFMVRLCIGAAPFLLVLLLQVVFGMQALRAGLMILLLAIGSILMRTLASGVYMRLGFRRILMAAAVVTGGSFVALGFTGAETSLVVIVALLLTHGFSRSVELAGVYTLSFADVPEGRMSAASTLSGVAGLLSQSVGIALATLALNWSRVWRSGAALDFVDVRTAFIVLGAIGAAAALMFVGLPANAGASLSSSKPA
jgi:EmrB/QacA subfamily drug resistance transporter